MLAGRTVDDAPPDDDAVRTALRAELDAGGTRRDAVDAVTAALGVPRRRVYALAIAL